LPQNKGYKFSPVAFNWFCSTVPAIETEKISALSAFGSCEQNLIIPDRPILSTGLPPDPVALGFDLPALRIQAAKRTDIIATRGLLINAAA
jgi:hypothetical protein